MANSSFFKNTGTSTQLQGSASASAAAALASEQAALASENAAQTSETNAAASAAAALASKNAAASSAASANSDASAASISATASQTAATSSSANAALTSADATQTAADRVQTGLDRIATAADAVQTAADRVQTGLDVTSTGASAAAALSSRNAAATSETNASASATAAAADAASTAADVISTAADAASTAADALATAADRVQTGLDATSASNSASAANTSASAASASQIAAASSAASAAAVFSDFEDRYYGPHATDAAAQTHVTGLGLTVDQGDLYFNSTANEMRVYDGGSWVAASSAGGASLINYHYTATASQTAFSGSDDNSNTLSYTVDNLIVTRNGVVLEDGTDYTATDGSTITLSVAAAAGDEINVVAFKSFTTADMVSATNGGTFQSNVTVNGTVTATAFSGDGSALTGITIPTLSSLGIANHDQVTVTAGGAVTATSFSGDGSSLTGIPTPTLTSLGIANHDQVTVDGSGNVDVTGTVTADYLNITAADNAITSKIANTTGANYLQITNGTANGYFGTTGTNTVAMMSISAHPLTFGVDGGVERMRIDSSGRVGIGTSSPAYNLDVYNPASTGAPLLAQFKSAGGDTQLYVDNSTITTQLTADSFSNSGIVGTKTNHPFVFRTNNIERMRIDSSGRVTMPYQPFALVDFGGGGYLSMSGTAPFDNIVQSQGNHYNASTYKFTCPVAGVYMVTAKFITSGTSDVGSVDLFLNGVRTFISYTVYRGLHGTFIIKCAANDVLHLNLTSLSYYQDVAPSRYSWASYQLMY